METLRLQSRQSMTTELLHHLRPQQLQLDLLMRRALNKRGDPVALDQPPPAFEGDYPPETPNETEIEQGGSLYGGTGTVFSEEFGPKGTVPANSFTSSYDARRRHRFSDVPDSLLHGEIPEGDFDEELALRDLPPSEPPRERILPRAAQVPAALLQRRRKAPSTAGERSESVYDDEHALPPLEESRRPSPQSEMDREAETPDREKDQPPIPYGGEEDYDREPSVWSEDEATRDPARQLPPPAPVDLPTPVGTPQYPQVGPSMRPPYPPGGMPPYPPGVAEVPRPSMPRIAGVRDPISTT